MSLTYRDLIRHPSFKPSTVRKTVEEYCVSVIAAITGITVKKLDPPIQAFSRKFIVHYNKYKRRIKVLMEKESLWLDTEFPYESGKINLLIN